MPIADILLGNNLELLKNIADNSVDAIVTDPPYGLRFMGKKWDYEVPTVAQWEECLRVLKPGGYLLSFAGTRTQHRMACNIEDAGFEIRDMIAWVYGSGFPKSLDIGKAVDKLQGNDRKVTGINRAGKNALGQDSGWNVHENKIEFNTTKGNSDWEGWGTALKPAMEPISIGYKPLQLSNIFCILATELTNLLEDILCQKSIVNASDVAKNFQSIRQLLKKEEESFVVDNARILNWENIENVVIAAVNFTYQSQQLIEKDIVKVNSVLKDVKEIGKSNSQEIKTQIGEEVNWNGVVTFISELTTHISENTVLLWRNILEELLQEANTYTISTAIRKTIELKTLRSLLCQNISTSIGNELNPQPNLNPVIMARKPLSEKTVAENCLKWGTGGINIDECRVECEGGSPSQDRRKYKTPTGDYNGWDCTSRNGYNDEHSGEGIGRFPANLIHDGSDEVLECFPQSNGAAAPVKKGQTGKSKGIYGDYAQKGDDGKSFRNDSGSAARFFYCAKASRSERNLGCDKFETNFDSSRPWCTEKSDRDRISTRLVSKQGKNNHPTVKPIKLMEYLIKLVSREGAIILDPWGGSGTTGIACVNLKRQFIIMEDDKHSYDIMRARISHFIPEVNINTSPKKELKFGDQMSLF